MGQGNPNVNSLVMRKFKSCAFTFDTFLINRSPAMGHIRHKQIQLRNSQEPCDPQCVSISECGFNLTRPQQKFVCVISHQHHKHIFVDVCLPWVTHKKNHISLFRDTGYCRGKYRNLILNTKLREVEKG